MRPSWHLSYRTHGVVVVEIAQRCELAVVVVLHAIVVSQKHMLLSCTRHIAESRAWYDSMLCSYAFFTNQ